MKLTLDGAGHLSDADLIERLQALASRERAATAELIVHLAELGARRLHLAAGYSSLFAYCRSALRLSEHEAYHRITAARAARRFPLILEMLIEGALTLTTVRLLAPHLTPENHGKLLAAARGLGRREVERLVATLAPLPDAATSVRKLPAPAPAARPGVVDAPAAPASGAHGVAAANTLPVVAEALACATSPAAETGGAPSEAGAPTGLPRPLSPPRPVPSTADVIALSPERYRLQVTIGGDTLDKLRLAKDLLSHAVASGDDATVLDRALTLLIAELTKKKLALTDRPRMSSGVAPASRAIPAEVKRAVFLRDMGRCTYAGTAGHRCGERAFIQFHHQRPFAHDGPATVENVALRCRRHNIYEWRQLSTELRLSEGPPGGR